MNRFLMLSACSLAFVSVTPSLAHDTEPSAPRLEADVRFLADDALTGREAGTPGYDLAAGYVAGHYAAMGLKPTANGTYFQQVPFLKYRGTGIEANTLEINGSKTLGQLRSVEDYSSSGTAREMAGIVQAPLVFVGYGFAADGYKRDDFAGVDLTGKIAVVMPGAPSNLGTEERAHFGETLRQRLSERGAVGVLTLWTPEREKRFSWAEAKDYFAADGFEMNWLGPDGKLHTASPNIRVSAVLSPAVSEALFAGQPVSWADVAAAEANPKKQLKSFDMGMTAKITFANESTPVTSPNVIGVIPGTDPKLASEVVVVTAHLDHEGVKPTEEEGDDEIYNGAMDNATGMAAIMEVARILVEEPPRRTVMFVGLTAEEKGLRGSEYLARYPVLAEGQKFVANINLDMPTMTYPFSDVVAFGGERSTMYPIVQKAVADAGLVLSPDPQPHEGYFTRSDQYSFVEQGIPSLYLDTAFGNGGDVALPAFIKDHYHQVSDEADLVDFKQLARFTAVNVAVIEGVANMDEAPRWKKGDFFGKLFGGPMED